MTNPKKTKTRKIELKRMGLINWHTINHWQIIPFSDVTFITGDNKSGKTTIMDAIMASLYTRTDCFNLANDIGRKEKRTLHGYIRGEISDTKFLRNGLTYTHVVTELKKNNQTILFGLYCKISDGVYDEKGIKKIWWKATARLDDLIPVTNNKVNSLDEMTQKIEIIKYNTQIEARRELSRLLGISESAVGDETAFKQLTKILKQAVAFNAREASDVNRYLRDNIFAEEDIDIDEYKYTLEKQSKLQEELRDTQKEINSLKKIEFTSNEYTTAENDSELIKLTLDLVEKESAEKRIEKNKLRIKKAEEEIEYIKAQKAELDEEHDRATIEKDRVIRECGLSDISKNIDEQKQKLNEINEAKRAVDEYDSLAASVGENSDTDSVSTSLEQKTKKLEEERDIIQKLFGKKKELTEERNALQKRESADKRFLPAMNELTNYMLKNGRTKPEYFYSSLTCDEDWQEAIEAYLGPHRYDIVVPPDDYKFAVNFIHDNFTGQVTIIDLENITKSEAKGLATVLHSSNPFVQDYITYKYSNVKLSDNAAKEKNGTYIDRKLFTYSGRRFSSMRKVSLIIGEKARIERIQAIEKEIEKLDEEIANHKDLCEGLRKHADICKKLLKMHVTDKERKLAASKEDEERRLKNLEESKSVLMFGDTSEKISLLEEKIADTKKKKTELEEKNVNCHQVLSESKEIISKSEEILKGLQYLDDMDISSADELRSKKSVQKMKEEREALETQKINLANDLKHYVAQYNSDYGRNFNSGKCLERLYDLDNDKIPKLISDFEESKNETRKNLIEYVIAEMKSRIRKANRFIVEVNRTLKEISFNGDYYALKKIQPADGKSEWFHAINNYVAHGETYSLFSLGEEKENEELVSFLFEKLLEQSEGLTSENYLDYTTFCKFGLEYTHNGEARDMQQAIGKGSGAEVQIPVYMILAIALVNKTDKSKFSLKESPALRLMCVDEAFEKMDSANRKTMLNLLSDEFGIQLVAAAPYNNFEDFLGSSTYIIMQNSGNNRYARVYQYSGTENV